MSFPPKLGKPAFQINLEATKKLITELQSANRSGISLRKLMTTTLHEFGFVPVSEGKLQEKTIIIRGRLNEVNIMFTSERDLSYHPYEQAIRNYGRASVPLRPVFYGTILTESYEAGLDTVLSELGEIRRLANNTNRESRGPIFLTLGVWRVRRPFSIAEVVFSRRFIAEVPWVRESFIHYFKNFSEKLTADELEAVTLIMNFISDEFAKSDISSHEDYLVSAAYSQFLLESNSVEGLIYPSTRKNGHSVNVALYPFTVDKCLELVEAQYMKINFDETATSISVEIQQHTVDLGPLNTKFTWSKPISRTDA